MSTLEKVANRLWTRIICYLWFLRVFRPIFFEIRFFNCNKSRKTRQYNLLKGFDLVHVLTAAAKTAQFFVAALLALRTTPYHKNYIGLRYFILKLLRL